MSSQESIKAVDSVTTPHLEKEGSTPTTADSDPQDATPEQKVGQDGDKIDSSERGDSNSAGDSMSPSQSSNNYPQGLPNPTSQQAGYYVAYNQSQVTPEPPSPAGPGGATVYDVGSFLQPGAAFHGSPFAGAQQYGQAPQPPHSPAQNNAASMGGIPPASPLFPRITGQATAGLLDHNIGSIQQRGAPLSPGPPYLAQLGPSSMYPNMGAYTGPAHNGSSNSNTSPDEYTNWAENRYDLDCLFYDCL